MYNVHAVTVQAFQEIKTFTVQAFQEIKSLKRFRGATRNGEYYHDMMACDGSSKPDSEFVQVQVARCNKISSLESPKIFSCGLRLYDYTGPGRRSQAAKQKRPVRSPNARLSESPSRRTSKNPIIS
jgi:HJR/Mrr/RecB family endonuclease